MLCDLENMFESLKLNATRCGDKNVRLGAKVVKGTFGTQIIPKYPRILLYSFLRSIAETANPLCAGSLLFMTRSDDIGIDGHLATLLPESFQSTFVNVGHANSLFSLITLSLKYSCSEIHQCHSNSHEETINIERQEQVVDDEPPGVFPVRLRIFV